jgi:hypothetical protein
MNGKSPRALPPRKPKKSGEEEPLVSEIGMHRTDISPSASSEAGITEDSLPSSKVSFRSIKSQLLAMRYFFI